MILIQKYKLNQRHSIIISITVFLLMFFILGFIFFAKKIQNTEKYSSNYYLLQSIYYQLTNEKKQVFSIKEFSEEFYKSTPENQIIELTNFYETFNTTLSDIQQNKRTEKYKFDAQLNKISLDITNYYQNILRILTLLQEIGNENYGISKNLDIIKFDLETIFSEENINKELVNQINQLFNAANNFKLTGEIEYYVQFTEIYTKIELTSNETDTTNVYNKYLISKTLDYLTEYKDNFYLVIEKNIEIGLSESEGIRGELNDAEKIIFENIASLIVDNKVKNKIYLVRLYIITIVYMVFFLILIILLISLISNYYNKNIDFIENKIKILASGEIVSEKHEKTTDEVFGKIEEQIIILNKSFKEKFDFANNIKNKKFESKLNLLSENDILGKSLIDLKESLHNFEIESQRIKKADDIQDWQTLGLAKFGEVMRKNTDNLQQLSKEVIKNLIDYVGASLGGFYIYNDENQNNIFLELMAFYAYGKEKIADKQIELYEGLIGTCAVEKNKFYFEKIPDDYIYMSSGFGHAKPESLIIIPLTVDKNVYGVIELASTRKFYDYEIDFLDKLAVDIAITVSYVKINDETARFLKMSERQTRKLLRKQHDYDAKIKNFEEELKISNKALIKKEQVLKLKDELIADKVREIKRMNIDLKNKISYIEKQNEEIKGLQFRLEDLTKLTAKEKNEFVIKISILESEIQRLKESNK